MEQNLVDHDVNGVQLLDNPEAAGLQSESMHETEPQQPHVNSEHEIHVELEPEQGQDQGQEQEQEQDQGQAPETEVDIQPMPQMELEGELEPQTQHPSEGQPKEGCDNDSAVGSEEKKWPGWPGESVFRMLVPAQKVGSIIGRKGEFIKKIVEETKARVKILDGPPGTSERAVMVSGKEEPDSPLPPAVDGLLRVHKRIIDGLEGDQSHAQLSAGGKVSTRLLLPASQAGSLIGKQGGTVKSIQESSNCIVRVLGLEELPAFALQDDRVVEVLGDPTGVHKAVELIASHLRKFLVDRSIIPIFEMQMQRVDSRVEHMPPHQSWGRPQGFPPNAGGGPGFGPGPQFMPPPRQHDNYYPPADLPPPVDMRAKLPHHGISAYGREPMAPHAPSNAQSAPSMTSQITEQMQIPLSYADAVIGTSGSSISYIRRTSGATVSIQETRGVPTEMTVEISGTASQVQTAQQLIHNFMAEAAQNSQSGASGDQGYNSYGVHGGSMYASPASNPGHGGHAGGYGSGYGGNYGY